MTIKIIAQMKCERLSEATEKKYVSKLQGLDYQLRALMIFERIRQHDFFFVDV